jgi:hypothetical protein
MTEAVAEFASEMRVVTKATGASYVLMLEAFAI